MITLLLALLLVFCIILLSIMNPPWLPWWLSGLGARFERWQVYRRWASMLNMDHMRTWWIFGYEPWGWMRPAKMTRIDGAVYKPLLLGLWLRVRKPCPFDIRVEHYCKETHYGQE